VAQRRQWAHAALLRMLVSLMIISVCAVVRKELEGGRTLSDRLMDVTVGPTIVVLIGMVVLFLVNRRVQDELVPQPSLLRVRPPQTTADLGNDQQNL
ncbi:MAG: hypothetical protein ABI273_04025, partial [Lacunisphaera sp.]